MITFESDIEKDVWTESVVTMFKAMHKEPKAPDELVAKHCFSTAIELADRLITDRRARLPFCKEGD